MTKASYHVFLQGDFLCILDRHDGGKSVTNAAEDVIAELAYLLKHRGENINRYAVIYRDTMGYWDQLLTREGKFQAFRSLGGTADFELATTRALIPA